MKINETNVNKKGLAVVLSTALVCPPYVGLIFAGSLMEDFLSPKIKTEKELQNVLNESADELGLCKRGLIGRLVPYSDSVCYIEGLDITNKKFVSPDYINDQDIITARIVELGGIHATKAKARHEVYHLKKHLNKHSKVINPESGYKEILRYLFYEEPSAILYSLTGVKI